MSNTQLGPQPSSESLQQYAHRMGQTIQQAYPAWHGKSYGAWTGHPFGPNEPAVHLDAHEPGLGLTSTEVHTLPCFT